MAPAQKPAIKTHGFGLAICEVCARLRHRMSTAGRSVRELRWQGRRFIVAQTELPDSVVLAPGVVVDVRVRWQLGA